MFNFFPERRLRSRENLPLDRGATLLSALMALAGFASAAFVAYQPTAREGLDLLWLIPLAFGLCSLLFAKVYGLHRGGVGLKVLFAILFVRYVVSPFLVADTAGATAIVWGPASSENYRFAIFVTVAELIICMATIRIAWPRVDRYLKGVPSRAHRPERALTLGGLLALGFLAAVVLARGLDGVLSSFGFLVLTEKYELSVDPDSYAITSIQVAKSFLFVCLAIYCRQRYLLTRAPVWPVLAIAAAFLNVSTYFGYNRSLILQTAIATIATLVFAFPRLKVLVFVALVPVVTAILYGLVSLKQFNVSAEDGNLTEVVSTHDISNNIEAYVGGVWPLATSLDAADVMRNQVSILTPLKGFTDNIFLFKVPGFSFPNDLLAEVPAASDLYNQYSWPALGAALPLAGELAFYVGPWLAPIFILLINVLLYTTLVFVDAKSRLATGLQSRFVFTWLAALMGLTMSYCLLTLIWSVSKFAFFLVILFWVNNRFVLWPEGSRSKS